MLFVLFALLLFSKKSDPIYMSMCFFLLSAFTAVQMDRSSRWVQYPYTFVSLLGLPVASFWYWPLGSASNVELHAMLLAANPSAIVMVIGQILLLASYVLLAARICRELLESHVFAQLTDSLAGVTVT